MSWGPVTTIYGVSVPQAMRVQTEMELRMFRQNEFMYHKMREAALNNQPMQVMAEPSNEPAPALFHKKQ
jgi:SET and MYND domain-containing protein